MAKGVKEWCYLNSTHQLFSYIMVWKVNFQQRDDEVRFVLDQHA